MLKHHSEGFEALACGVFALKIIHAHHCRFDAGDPEPGIGFAVVTIDDFE